MHVGLDDFHIQCRPCYGVALHCSCTRSAKMRLAQLLRRQVDADAQRHSCCARRRSSLGGRPSQHPRAQRQKSQARVSATGIKRWGSTQPSLNTSAARFDADDAARNRVDLRLVMQRQRLAVDGPFGAGRAADFSAIFHPSTSSGMATLVAPGVFGVVHGNNGEAQQRGGEPVSSGRLAMPMLAHKLTLKPLIWHGWPSTLSSWPLGAHRTAGQASAAR